jgi:hypothetical protein
MARQALQDLFDQRDPFGRLALVQVLMLAGDTLVTISLAGSLFFSISPHAAKGKVILYLVLTLAPFAVVSPLLGPLIDRSRGARRAMVVISAVGRAAICPLMARDTHSLLLFPEAFVILILSKLYLVTRGALVPEMAIASSSTTGLSGGGWQNSGRARRLDRPTPGVDALVAQGEGNQPAKAPPPVEFASFNARLTLLGTLAGFVAGIPGVILLKTAGAPGVLIFDAFIFAAAAVAGGRLPAFARGAGGRPVRGHFGGDVQRQGRGGHESRRVSSPEDLIGSDADPDLSALQPIAEPEVLLGLTTMSIIRGLAGFLVLMLAFGLRRENASLAWYGFALGASGVGALLGLTLVGRLREHLREQQILILSIWLISAAAVVASLWGVLPAQGFLALVIGAAGSLAQPSFDAMTQRYVPPASQGRAFAKFAMRQQLVWCVGALIPVVISLPLTVGDVVIAIVSAAGGLFYLTSRQALRHRALPRRQKET